MALCTANALKFNIRPPFADQSPVSLACRDRMRMRLDDLLKAVAVRARGAGAEI